MNVLAIASSTETLSVAVSVNGQVYARAADQKRRHSAVLLDLVGEVLATSGLKAADLSGLAVDNGPGAFTGVRTAIAAVQGLALAWSLPVVPVSAFAAMRSSAPPEWEAGAEGKVLCVLDARMGEAYHAVIDARSQSLSEPAVGPPESLRGHESEELIGAVSNLTGPLLEFARRSLPNVLRWHHAEPSAAGVLRALAADPQRLARSVEAHELTPSYVRNQVALTIAQRQGLGHAA
ncbi:tRNA (adenosine(37)-N6)-threonylcarbamoyltransferase complex dimerization subunit type 1 TsaB [Piscinibacterium candidicorallinum]|uniref:tRNA (Adenosine(37)-N6)-threonylcarbamoyltransferase complex dimerization subunit type 1 TsaB n=1 Tax=Piscinibacterium candidicorallinum TaxID=1793872 RepID=A0ABV7H2S0_9BURK